MASLILPSEGNGDNSSAVLSYLEESRLSHIEVLEGRVAPAAVVVRQGQVRGAKVGGGDDDGSGEAPFRIIVTSHFIT